MVDAPPAERVADAVSPGRATWYPTGWAAVILVVLALAFTASGLYQAADDSPTVDEGIDLSSGVTALVRHDLRLSPEHPFGGKALAVLPALLAHPIVPSSTAYRRGQWFDYSDDFIRANQRAGRLREVLFLSRLVPLVEALGCALLVYVLARKLWGADAAFLAAALWLTTPVFLGLGHVISLDISFTLATLAVSLALLRFLERPTTANAVWIGALTGISLTVRHTGLVLLVVAVVVVVVRLRRQPERLVRPLLVVVGLSFAVVWLVYRVLAPASAGGAVAARFSGIIGAAQHKSLVARLVLALPFPPEWRAGFGYLTVTSVARPASALGQSWVGTRWWYFPASVLVKVPLPTLLALVVGTALLVWRPGRPRERALLAVALPAVALLLFTLAQPLDLGVRLVLPSLALWLVLASPVADLARRSRVALGALALVGVVQVASFAAATPHSLAWTPWPFQPAYRWASDSNVDYGQDVYRLADWARGRDAWTEVATTRGLQDLVPGRSLVGVAPSKVTGWVAVGVTSLTELDTHRLAWLRAYCPVGTIGGSVLLYRFDRPPSATPGPERPVAPCFGARFSRR